MAEMKGDRYSGYTPHAPPLLVDDGGFTSIRIPDEEGYFPTGAASVLLSCEAQIFQMNLQFATKIVEPISSGTLTLSDPSPGTVSEVALVCECNGIIFYVTNDDATKKISTTEFMLLLPADCIGVHLAEHTPEASMLLFEALLAARTKFKDESEEIQRKEMVYPEALPDDNISRAMYRMSKWTSNMVSKGSVNGAKQIENLGQKKRSTIANVHEKKVKESHIKLAKGARKTSEFTLKGVNIATDAIASTIASVVGKHAVSKEGDSDKKKRSRQILISSSIAYGEFSDSVGEAYSVMAKSAQKEAVSFVAEKYGKDASELVRHTAGATFNFGKAALTSRRIVNVKAIAKKIAKEKAKSVIMK